MRCAGVPIGARIPFKCGYRCLIPCDPNTAPYCIARALFNAVEGDADNAIVFAGSDARRHRIAPTTNSASVFA
jgi:hypothetical protein